MKFWNPETFEISSYKYSLNSRINKTYNTSGSDNTGKCTYTYNELGFRGDSVSKDGFKIMSIGCSLTEGVGVNDDETWSHQISALIPNGVDLNFGVGGRSNDYICRCLLSYYDTIKPDLVLIMYTFLNRKEFYTPKNEIEPFMPTNSWGYMEEDDFGKNIQKNLSEVQNRYEDIINWYKNHLIITQFLKQKGCNYVWNGSLDVPTDYTDEYRFDGDYKNFIDISADGLHPGHKHNEIYAKKLYNHLISIFNLPTS